ncbi:fumarylacetoacetate hydrolase family protein [Streptomyces spongiae]|uniref:fumarylacetoacetate hydrolase family protein n=1 Tax=Streptomyces spongiae TaxID=565072 RepID=UPI0018845859|nr:fumarylacetoacetate hydrolase family protein [Streptomyces spongiae]
MTRFALGGPVPTVVVDDVARRLDSLLPDAPPRLEELFADWDGWCDRIEAAVDRADPTTWEPVSHAGLRPVPVAGATIYACGANYYDHVEEMGATPPDKTRERVFHFLLPPSAVIGDGEDVLRPPGCEQLDYEVELVAVLARGGSDIPESEALSYVAGYTVANDVSVRDPWHKHPIFGVNFLIAKGQSTLKPFGSLLVPARFVPQPGLTGLSTRVNGEIRQDSSTKQMIWSLAEQIAALSATLPLRAGDVILTGTPAGTSAGHGRYLDDGDVVTVRVEGVGSLTNHVVGRR